jgi:hypothetical protein
MLLTAGCSLAIQPGCSDLLGLEGLTFEEDPATDGAGGTGGIGAGGETPSPLTFDEFPAQWPRGLLLSSLEGVKPNSPYWYFDPEQDELHAFQYRPDLPDEVRVDPWLAADPWEPRPTEFFVYEQVGGDWAAFAYESTQGFSIYQPLPKEQEEAFAHEVSHAGTPGRTEAILFLIDGRSHVLAYSSDSGFYRHFPLDSPVPADVCTGKWETGWTSIHPHRQGEVQGVLLHNQVTQQLAFRNLEDCGEDTRSDFTIILEPAVSLILPFFGHEGSDVQLSQEDWGPDYDRYHPVAADVVPTDLFFYGASGELRGVNLHVLDDGTDGDDLLVGMGGSREGEQTRSVLIQQVSSLWLRAELTAIVPIRTRGLRSVISYDSSTGVADLNYLDLPGDEKIPPIVK